MALSGSFDTFRDGEALALILVLYPGLGLIVPLAAGFSTYYLVLFNLVGVVMAAVIGLGWTEVFREAIHRRHLLDWTTELRHFKLGRV